MLKCIIVLKSEPLKVQEKIVGYEMQTIAHNESDLDARIVLYVLPGWRRTVNNTKIGKSISF